MFCFSTCSTRLLSCQFTKLLVHDVTMRPHGRAWDTCVCVYICLRFFVAFAMTSPVAPAPPSIPPPARNMPSLRGGGGPGVAAAATMCCQHNATAHGNMVPVRVILQCRFFSTHISPAPATSLLIAPLPCMRRQDSSNM